MCLSAMLRMAVPHINIMSKMDLRMFQNSEMFSEDDYLEESVNPHLESLVDMTVDSKRRALNKTLVDLLNDFKLVSFHPLDITDKESLSRILYHIDMATHYERVPEE